MYKTIKVVFQPPICFLTFARDNQSNTINSEFVLEVTKALDVCESMQEITILILQGNKQSFCLGADFREIAEKRPNKDEYTTMAKALYAIWLRLTQSACITIAHVEGNVNAGGLGFVSACDIVISHESVSYSLSELLFGLFPACVLPFLQRRIGFQRSHYLALSTKAITSLKAQEWGLVDATGDNTQSMLRNHLVRLAKLDRAVVRQYKEYNNCLYNNLEMSKGMAIQANAEMFSNPIVLEKINSYLGQNIYSGLMNNNLTDL